MLKRILVGAAVVAGVVVLGSAPKADAGVDFSFGIGVPAVTYYDPPTVVYRTYDRPVRYDAPRAYYDDVVDYGYGYRRYDDGRRDGGWRHRHWRRHHRHCD